MSDLALLLMGTTQPTERNKLAFSSASDASKQVLTLSTALLTFTVAFRKDIARDVFPTDELYLGLAWIFFGVAIVCGVWSMLALAGVLGRGDEPLETYVVSVRAPAGLQMFSFVIGLLLIAVFGIAALSGPEPSPSDSDGTCTITAPASGDCSVPDT